MTQLPPTERVRALAILEPGKAMLVTSAEGGELGVRFVGAGPASDGVALRDPAGRVPFVIENHLVEGRTLTHDDFDVSAAHRADDGTLWIGEQRGPFLLHFDAEGVLLEPPYALTQPGCRRVLVGPDNPLDERNAALGLMRALERHARVHGAKQPLSVSNDHRLLADHDPATGFPWRAGATSSDLFDPTTLQDAGFPVIPWTVNDPVRMRALLELGVAGIITDRPDLLYTELQSHDADGDGQPGDLLEADGRVDAAHFDLQGHRGARNLRPENTLPAMEAGLDAHVTTLELDVGLTADGVAVVSHDPVINPSHCRRRDGGEYGLDDARRIRDVTLEVVQGEFVCDVTTPSRPTQANARELSPVAVAFAEREGLADPYTMPTLAQVYGFVDFYAAYYRDGPGADHESAPTRAADAARVRLNVETKTNPVVPEETIELERFVQTTAKVVVEVGAQARTNIQSFDFRGNLLVQAQFPEIATAYLFGDTPAAFGYDGANLENAAWRAGLPWPYLRQTPSQVSADGGIGGLSESEDGRYLYAVLRRGLAHGDPRATVVFVFDLERRAFLPVRHAVPMDAETNVLAGLAVVDDVAFVVERGDAQASLRASSLTATDPGRQSSPIAGLPAATVEALWRGEAGTVWRAAVEDGAVVWRAYTPR